MLPPTVLGIFFAYYYPLGKGKTMMTNIFCILVASLFLFVSCTGTATVDPSINGEIGTLTNGSDYTITGSGFGEKNPVEPMWWDNFETYAVPGEVGAETNDPYNTALCSTVKPIYTKSMPRSEPTNTVSIMKEYFSSDMDPAGLLRAQSSCRFVLDQNLDLTNSYITFWYKMDMDYYNNNPCCSPRNTKFMELRGYDPEGRPALRIDVPFNDACQCEKNASMWAADYNDGNPIGTQYPPLLDTIYGENSGHYSRLESWLNYDGMDATTSEWSVSKDLSEIGKVSGVFATTEEFYERYPSGDGPTTYNTIWLTHYIDADNDCAALGHPELQCGSYVRMYYDDLYIDNTMARIEICNNKDKSLSSHCEVQIPKELWNDTAIKFTAQKGSFLTGEQLYLHVINRDGNSNEEGLEVKFN